MRRRGRRRQDPGAAEPDRRGAVSPVEASIVHPTGRRMFLNLADGRAHTLLEHGGSFNPLSLVIWEQLVRAGPWEVVLDVGTNYGEMVLYADTAMAGIVVAVEPNPVVLTALDRTLVAFDRDVLLVPVALGADEGLVGFHPNREQSGMSAVSGAPTAPASGHDVLVFATTLDRLADEAFPADAVTSLLVKVDVEGAEAEVLRGAVRTLGRFERVALMLEVLHADGRALLRDRPGYRVSGLVTEQRRFREITTLSDGDDLYPQDLVLWKSPPGTELEALLAPSG